MKYKLSACVVLLAGIYAAAPPVQAATPGKWLDYDGDGKTDYALWRPSDGTWYIIPSGNPGNPVAQQWGLPGDIPVSGDYDGDGKADFALWRPSEGIWYVIPSSNPGSPITQQLGQSGDIPVPDDFDGDGKADYALWRPASANWYIIPSSNPGNLITQQLGQPGDIPVPDDFDGDGKTDYALWRPSDATWYIIPSGNPGNLVTQQWGQPGDIPVPGDFDGDGKTDYAVWRPSDGNWYIIPSSNPGNLVTQQWGQLGDIPLSTLAPAVISGQITAGGAGLPGVTITLSGSATGSATTDANGNYSFVVPAGGTYTVTPTDTSGDTFQPSRPQPLTMISANQTLNFLNDGNGGGYNPPLYSNFLNSAPPPGPGPANCADISGSWTDSSSNTWALLQNGGTVGGSLTQPSTGIVWQISGTGAGLQYTLTASNPNPSAVGGVYEGGESINWISTSCNSADGPTTLIAPSGDYFLSTGTNTEPGPTITLVRSAAPTYTLTSPSSSPVPGSTNGAQFLAFSTGDSNVQLKTTASVSNISVDEVYTSVFQGDPAGTCHAILSMPDGTGTGSATSSISASPAGCSGIFQIWGAGGGTTTNTMEVVVPPQIMIRTEVGEAGAQTQPGDDSMIALLLTARNRFGDKRFPGASGGPALTWQDALTAPGQYYGYVNTTPNGVQPELNYAAEVYSGATTVDILNCEAYWSPKNAQYATLLSWYNANTPANAISDDSWPNLVGAPRLWLGEPKQAVIKGSIKINARTDSNLYNAAPAFVLFREAPSGTAPAVIRIP